MRDEPTALNIGDAAQHRALAHQVRQRILMSLRGEPATVSQLARRLGLRKGTVGHHLGILVEARMVQAGEARRVRGGTEQYYEVSVGAIIAPGNDAVAATLSALTEQFKADTDALLHLRHVRLTSAQAQQLRRALEAIVAGTSDAGHPQPTYGILVGLYRRN